MKREKPRLVPGFCFFAGDYLDDFLRREDFLPDDFRGTFAPFFLASERAIAIACLRLFTLPPLPPLPDLSVPFFRRRMADSTRLLAAFPYFRLLDDFFRAAILNPPQ